MDQTSYWQRRWFDTPEAAADARAGLDASNPGKVEVSQRSRTVFEEGGAWLYLETSGPAPLLAFSLPGWELVNGAP